VDPAQAQRAALAILDRQIGAQASVLAFSKIYLLSGILLVAALPVLLLFHTGKSRAISGSAAH
jgi:DHA2 family multidrug resistance protein